MIQTCTNCKNYDISISDEPCRECQKAFRRGGEKPNFVSVLTNYDLLIRKSPEELAELLTDVGVRTLRLHRLPVAEPVIEQAKEDWLGWLIQEADNGQHDS